MEYVGTAVVAFVAGLISGRLRLTVAVVAALWLLGWVIVVSGEVDNLGSHGIAAAVGLGILIAFAFATVAVCGAWAGVALRRRLRQT